MRPKISIVFSTFNRATLLDRSLERYYRQPFPDFELICIDDYSQDNTEAVVRQWEDRLNLIYIRPSHKSQGEWRDCSSTINLGLRAAKGEFVIATHPEVLVNNLTLQQFAERSKENTYLCAKIYYLSPDNQICLDEVDWQSSASEVRHLPGFYEGNESPEFQHLSDYTHSATDSHTHWESWVFGGLSRKTWHDIGGFDEFSNWGTVDLSFLRRRQILGIPTETLLDPETICVHQNHDTLSGQYRDSQKAMASVPHYNSREICILDNL